MSNKKIFLIIAFVFFLGACSHNAIYVPHGDAVKLRETIKKAKVWIKTKEGNIIPGEMDLPNGWYCLPLEENTDNKEQ